MTGQKNNKSGFVLQVKARVCVKDRVGEHRHANGHGTGSS